MLQNLHVKNLALITETEVEFKEGLNILTGETGAGKSIIIGSVALALERRFQRNCSGITKRPHLWSWSFRLKTQRFWMRSGNWA